MTMKAIVQHRYGGPEALALDDVPRPEPGPRDVLVRVHAASVNARDWHVMRGDPRLARYTAPGMFGRKGPRNPTGGTDFAGHVKAVGAGVTRFRPGDEVFGDSGEAGGAFAEFIRVPADLLAEKPAGITFAEAAALPLAGSTALAGLRAAGIERGQRLLVNGASGGVGTYAIQIARASGAEVTAVCSTRNVAQARALGADHVVDYTREDFARAGRRYDVVFDLVANRRLADLRTVLTPTGTLVLSGGGVFDGGSLVGPMGLVIKAGLLSRFVRHRLIRLDVSPNAANLMALADLVKDGAVKPIVDRTFPLAETPAAIRYVETEHARGKVVIEVP